MKCELNFEVEPLEAYSEFDEYKGEQPDGYSEFDEEVGSFDTEQAEEWEEEARRGRRIPIRAARFRPRPVRPPRPPRRWPPGPPWPPRPPRPRPVVILREPPTVEYPPQGMEYLRWVQDSLNRILGLRLPVDGIMGPETRSAIRSFQAREALPVTGIVGPDTERALIEASASQPPETGEYEAFDTELADFEWQGEVSRNSPEYIRWVQQSLNKILGLRLAVNGVMGSQTRSAIRSFQQQRGLRADGVVGPQSERALIAAGASSLPGTRVAPSIGAFSVRTLTGGVPTPTKREDQPPSYTLYMEIPLGSEGPAMPMTGIFIPENYSPRPQVDLILYLHGHKTTRVCGPGESISIDGYWRSRYWPLREEINKSGKNIILVAPTLGPKSQPGRLTDPGAFEAYLDQVMAALIEHGPYRKSGRSPTFGNIVLACHSGGGSPMLRLALANHRYADRIRECWGFDCLYSGYADKAKTRKLFTQPQKWIEWAESHKTQRLFIYYKGSTAAESKYLEKKARDKNLLHMNVFIEESTRAPNHCWVPIEHWKHRIQGAGFLLDR